MILYNYHTHSIFSDGKSKMEEIVDEAVRQGLTAIGFSDHSPVPFESDVAIRNEELNNYVKNIRELKDKYQGKINVYCSMEMDYIPGLTKNFKKTQEELGLDYLIGSIHLVGNDADRLWFIDGSNYETFDEGLNNYFGGDIRKAVRDFFYQSNEMIEKESFDIIGHFDKIKMHNRERFFREDEKWYRDYLMETLSLIKEKSLIVEINTRGIYKKRYKGFYPSDWLFPTMKAMNIPVIISSDAHVYNEISLCFDEAREALKVAGYNSMMMFKGGIWIEVEM